MFFNIFIILIIYFIININSEVLYDNLDSFDECGRGTYKTHLTDSSGKLIGEKRNCQKCPRGKYGSTIGLTTDSCTDLCPVGTYNDILGAQTIDDCKLCPVGKYGSTRGLKSNSCSGSCPVGKFSRTEGLTSVSVIKKYNLFY
jgi:hypothetical protein